MDYQKQNLNTLKSVAKANTTNNFDWDIIVPDIKPDVATVISCDGTVNILSKEIMQDRAVINGNVKINILYIASDNEKCVKSIENVQNFNYVLELSGARQNMFLDLHAYVLKITSNVLNSRKINVSCTMNFLGTAYDNCDISYVEGVDCDDVICKRKEIKTLNMSSCFEKSFVLSENVEVPAGKISILEILKVKPEFSQKSVKGANGKLVLRGNILISTAYIGNSDEDFVQFMTHEIPVNEIIDCDKINENSLFDYDVYINNFNYILKDNSEGEKRIIKLCADVWVKGKVYEEISVYPVVDAYSLENNLSLEKNNYCYDEILNSLSGQFLVKDTATLTGGGDIQKIVMMEVSSEIDAVENGYGVVKIKGNIPVNVLYITSGGETLFKKSILPFEYSINIEGASSKTLCDLKLDIDSYSYNILSFDSIELRVNFSYTLRVKNSISQEIVENLECEPDKNKKFKHKITVFFCDGSENLWDIAKKYRTTVEDIMLANDLENDESIVKGMKILIP